MNDQQSDSEQLPENPDSLNENKEDNGSSSAPADPLAAEEHDALGWLADDVGQTPIEEMPTMQWHDELLEELKPTSGPISMDVPEADLLPDAERVALDQDLDELDGDSLSEAEIFAAEDVEDAQSVEAPTLARSATDEETRQKDQVSGHADSEVSEEPVKPIENIEDAMLWLEQLAAGQGTPIEEMPTMISGSEEDQKASAEATEESTVSPGDDPSSNQVESESFDDPVDWLEKLAADQTSPLDELPSVADRLLASDIVSQVEESRNGSRDSNMARQTIKEAVAFLEGIAVAQGIDLNRVSLAPVELDGDVPSFEELDALAGIDDDLSKTVAESGFAEQIDQANSFDELSTQMPEDPDEALAWLGHLAKGADLPESELVAPSQEMEIVHEAETPARAMLVPDIDELLEDEELELSAANEDTVLENADKKAQPELENDAVAVEENEATLVENNNEWPEQATLDDMPDDPDEMLAWMRDRDNIIDEDLDSQLSAELFGEEQDVATLDEQSDSGAMDSPTELIDALKASYGEAENKSTVIPELEAALVEYPAEPKLVRLLGDAYMEAGQLEKALETYRKGFDQL